MKFTLGFALAALAWTTAAIPTADLATSDAGTSQLMKRQYPIYPGTCGYPDGDQNCCFCFYCTPGRPGAIYCGSYLQCNAGQCTRRPRLPADDFVVDGEVETAAEAEARAKAAEAEA
ncbi:hypothetical protein CPLU01_11912 [Colletotrichum plurivorum]|uniref:Uncharacterized protein n=1 Tax=Colletotrichum plurivorum TaxID=2175906 RepID=A0A8H6N6X0_9PEZI|nr:hypothetical protein CPLU01_11912 [Colletotrichum plurivorum]